MMIVGCYAITAAKAYSSMNDFMLHENDKNWSDAQQYKVCTG